MLQIPRIELAQIAPRAVGAEVLDGALHHPFQLDQDLVVGGSGGPRAEHLPEQPRVAERPAREHDRRRAGALVGAEDRLRGAQAAGEDDRRIEASPPAERRARSRACPCGAPRRCGVKADRADARVVDEAVRELVAVGLPRALAGAQLHGDRQARALASGARHRHRGVGVLDERRAGAGLAHLGHRAAHVEVDEVGAVLGHRCRRRAHDVGVVAEELDGDRPARALVGMDAQQLAHRLLVAVVDGEARDHLRHRQPGPVALGLQAHEPVADPGQGREQHPVGDLDGPDPPRRAELRRCAHATSVGR